MGVDELPLILLVFSNDRRAGGAYLRDLAREKDEIGDALRVPERLGLCRVSSHINVTMKTLFELLATHKHRIVGVHFGGHAEPDGLHFETDEGDPDPADMDGIGRRLGQLPNLRWIFLNGCSTRPHLEVLRETLSVPIIATDTVILDAVARDFAYQFYFALGQPGFDLSACYEHARDAVDARKRLIRSDAVNRMGRRSNSRQASPMPWRMHVDDDAARDWRLVIEEGPRRSGPRLRLRRAEPATPPRDPYPPVLGYYTDRRLFAGRDAELDDLQRHLQRAPIVCLFARSGAGKSSLLQAGLRPALRDAGVPDALVRTPHEGSAPTMLARQLLDPSPESPGPRDFARAVEAAHRLAEQPPVLILDQFEELFKGPHAIAARARLGPYLAATMGPGPACGDPGERPLCRWVLAYRHEFHGDVEAWLRDVLAEARAAGQDVADLPFDLLAEGRRVEWPLPPFGAMAPGCDDPDSARRAFREAIVKPLGLVEPPWHIAPEAADALATAFADARARQPHRPLVPELQVVLARLVRRAGPDRRLALDSDADLDAQIADALRDHVLSALERVVPSGRPGVRHRRALVLTALSRLVDEAGRRSRRLPAEDLLPIIGAGDGHGAAPEVILDALTGAEVRLLTVEIDDELGAVYALGHDRLAEVVAELVAEKPHGVFDPETLDLIDFVQRRAELHRTGDAAALSRDDPRFDRLARTPEIRWSPDRRAWWDAWRAETERLRAAERATAAAREERRRTRWLLALAGVVVVALGIVLWMRGQNEELRVSLEAERRARMERIEARREGFAAALASADPDTVLRGLVRLVATGLDGPQAVARLPDPPAVDIWTLMTETRADDPAADAAVRTALALSWLDRVGADGADRLTVVERFGQLLAALDIAERHGGAGAAAAREAVLTRMRTRIPHPRGVEAAALRGPMLELPGGAFSMGSPPDEPGRDTDEALHRVAVGTFAIGLTEVTHGAFRALVPDHRPETADDVPVVDVSWYAALAFAAWVEARLPSEAEWEYAVRDQGRQRARFCSGADEGALAAIAWYGMQSGGQPRPIRGKAACAGLYDMHGNVWEWVADWDAAYPDEADGPPTRDPIGPPQGAFKVARGGSYQDPNHLVRAAYRNGWEPSYADEWLGFRLARDTR